MEMLRGDNPRRRREAGRRWTQEHSGGAGRRATSTRAEDSVAPGPNSPRVRTGAQPAPPTGPHGHSQTNTTMSAITPDMKKWEERRDGDVPRCEAGDGQADGEGLRTQGSREVGWPAAGHVHLRGNRCEMNVSWTSSMGTHRASGLGDNMTTCFRT